MKNIKLLIISILFMIPLTVKADSEPKVLTLEVNKSGSNINYSGTVEDGSYAVMCKLYNSSNQEIDMLSTAVDNGEFSGSFTVTGSDTYKVSCANYEGGDFKSETVPVELGETKYTVTFNSNGGSNVPEILVSSGNTIQEPTQPEREGYTFEGWYEDNTLTTEFDFNTPITEDVTLYAKWTENIVSYTVTFNSNGGSDVPSININGGQTIQEPGNPEREGYTFDGWYEDNTLTTKFNFSTPITKNITLYAKWIDNNKKYDISDETGNGISFTEEKGHSYELIITDLLLLTDDELLEMNSSREEYNNVLKALENGTKKYGKVLAFYSIVVEDENDSEIDPGDSTIKVKMTDDMKKYNSFKLMYVDLDDENHLSIDSPINLTVSGDYLVGNLKHLSLYVLVGDIVNNPQTGDNVFVWISILTISLISLGYGTYKLRKINI